MAELKKKKYCDAYRIILHAISAVVERRGWIEDMNVDVNAIANVNVSEVKWMCIISKYQMYIDRFCVVVPYIQHAI